MAIAETSQPLSIESFSYSWLINIRPSLEIVSDSFRAALDSSDESIFIEMDPNMPPSKRFKKLNNDFEFDFDFDFDLPSEQSTAATAHADELFCNGLLMPFFRTSSAKTAPSFPHDQRRSASLARVKIRCSSLRRCRSLLSRKMFEKYLYFLCPLLEKIRCYKSSKSRKDRTTDNRIWAVKNNRNDSPQVSPRTSVGSSIVDWRMSCDSVSSIHEAVLHCKRSNGM